LKTLQTDNNFRAAERKALDREALAKAVDEAKQQGKSVVFTNGCFDILHVGHVRYLQDARSLGDMLVVGVNSDESVRKLKGPERPVVSELERVEILSALECVDYVSVFPEDTPIEIILAIKPSIHVKGGDYKAEDLPEASAVKSVGGRVEIVTFTSTASEGFSTSNLIGKIVKNHQG
jgi:D-glycero-beta-D-manno-heptose 1-phosphate adenylyltransferase